MNMLRPLALALGIAAAGSALAHTFLDHASPAVGATVQSSPRELRLWFSEALDTAHSTAEVFDQTGRGIGQQQPSTDPTLLVVALPELAPGRYRVVWRVRSADGHWSKGRFRFSVALKIE